MTREAVEKRMKRFTAESIDDYFALPLTLPIAEVPMRRVCEALTKHGYRTRECTDGGTDGYPKVWIECDDSKYVHHLAYIVGAYGTYSDLKALWSVSIHGSDPIMNELLYCLQPHPATYPVTRGRVLDPVGDKEALFTDLDVIGVTVLNYFKRLEVGYPEES